MAGYLVDIKETWTNTSSCYINRSIYLFIHLLLWKDLRFILCLTIFLLGLLGANIESILKQNIFTKLREETPCFLHRHRETATVTVWLLAIMDRRNEWHESGLDETRSKHRPYLHITAFHGLSQVTKRDSQWCRDKPHPTLRSFSLTKIWNLKLPRGEQKVISLSGARQQ